MPTIGSMQSRESPTGAAKRREVDTKIAQYLAANFPLGGDIASLAPTTSLLDAGVIDSTGVLELLTFIESEFGFVVPDEDLVPENFDSLDAIGRYVADRA
jgi:acyl carrier protein